MKAKDKGLFNLHAEFCKALAHPRRLETLHLLDTKGRLCAAALLEITRLSKTNLSQHMRALRQLGLVAVECAGIPVCYELSPPKIGEACELLRQFLTERLSHQSAIIEKTAISEEAQAN